MDSQSRRPPLSILVPSLSSSSVVRPDLPSPAKQKRLFPIACRVVPTDQWFTTRIDRTWSVKDLKVWLLSKALPSDVLPLPPSYRPSSPVTFAAAPPTATEVATATPYSSTTPSPDGIAISETTTITGDDVHDVPSSDRPARLGGRDLLPIPHSAPPPPPPLSIPYSYNTGAPAISGIEALKNRHPAPSVVSHASPPENSEFVQNVLRIADRWSLHSFSLGGMLLTDASPLSEYSLNPHELLELHRAGAYVPLPKTAQPSLPNPMSFPVDIGTRTASARAAASTFRPRPEKPPTKSKDKPKNRKHALKSEATNVITPSSSSLHGSYAYHHGQLSSATSSECESEQEVEEFGEIYGSPYAQPYFDGWAMVLRIRGLSSSSNKKGADKGKGREEEENGVSRCETADPPGLGSSSSGTESWKKMWVMVRENRISIRRQREDEDEERWFIGSCVGLYGIDKLKYLLGHDPPQTNPVRQHHRTQASTHQHPPSEPLPYRVSTNSSRKSARPGKDLTICAKFTGDSGGSRWLFLRALDSQTHEHLLRIIHRLAYTSPLRLHSIYPNPLRHSATQSISQSLSQSVDFPPLSPLGPHQYPHFRPTTHTMRTLRTEFLPNPIPHPLALSFSAPSPLTGQDDASDEDLPIVGSGRRRSLFDTASFASGDDELFADDDSTFSGSHHHSHSHYHYHASANSSFAPSSSSYGMGLGTGMGVRFPEWREDVLIRAVNAGLTGGLGMGGLDRREYVSHDRRHLPGMVKSGDHKDDDNDDEQQQQQQQQQDDPNDASNSRRDSLGTDMVVESRPPPPSLARTSRTSSLSETAVTDSVVDQAALGVFDDTESDSDSEAGSEKEWDGWAYDLDRLKGIKYPKPLATRVGNLGGAGGGGGGSDEDYEHVQYPSSAEKKSRRTTGRRDRARTIVGASVVGVTPTPMPTPTASSSPLGAGMDLFSTLAAFRIQPNPSKQQQAQVQVQQQSSTQSIPLSPTTTRLSSTTTLSTLSSNSTITPDREHDRRGSLPADSESISEQQQQHSSKPTSPISTTTKMSPLTRARSATVSAVAAVRSSPTSVSSSSSSSNVNVNTAAGAAQSRQPPPMPSSSSSSSKPKPKSKPSNNNKTKPSATGSERPRTAGDDNNSTNNNNSNNNNNTNNQDVVGGGSSGSSMGMKNLMRGLSMKAGKGLESAMDFVEGK